MATKSTAVALIAFGTGFLLYNLKIISFTPWDLLWPGLVIWFGASQLCQIKRTPRGAQNSWEIALWLIVLTVGIYMLLPNIGISLPSIPWKLVWPVLLIVGGILALSTKGERVFKVETGKRSDADATHQYSRDFRYSFVGEFNRGPGSWLLNDLQVRQVIGSVNLDLTKAIIPDREVYVDVYGSIGDVKIYLPPGLPFKANCSLSLGEITVVDYNESGSHRQIETESIDYKTAVRKVNIHVHWRVGDISIRQIQ